MPTQHIATLLGATCCVRLATLTVATCCDVLGVVGSNLIIFKLVAYVTSVSVSKERSVFCLREIWGRAKNGTGTKTIRGGGVGGEEVSSIF